MSSGARGVALLHCWTRTVSMLTALLMIGTAGWGADTSGATEQIQPIEQGTETVLCEGDCDGGDAVTH